MSEPQTRPVRHPSITQRLMVMFALAVLVTFSLVGATLYCVLRRELVRNEDVDITTNLQNIRYSIERSDTLERWEHIRTRMTTLTPSDGHLRFWVLSEDPRFRYGEGLEQLELIDTGTRDPGSVNLAAHGKSFHTRSVVIPALGVRPMVRLIVGVDAARVAGTLRNFGTALALATVVAMALVMLLGHWIARVGLAPLKRMSAQAQGLRPKTVSQRLRTVDLPVELADLGGAFNGALERLEDAYVQLEAFNADVAHELRTPLANLIGGTQVALSRPRSAPEFEEVLQSNLEELERLRSIINDMLFLARADQGENATELERTNAAQQVHKTIEFFEFVLDEAGKTVHVEGDLTREVTMNTALIRRALSNLLQNAIQHSPPQADLTVSLTTRGEDLWIEVKNPGETIAPAHLPRLFDRFFRADVARADSGEHRGHGLGLAIVKAVAKMHGGQVHADSVGGVTVIGFSLPVGAQG